MLRRLVVFALVVVAMEADARLPEPGEPGAPADVRYCGEPRRQFDGEIYRDRQAVERFKRAWPKPDDGREWHVDHVIPLSVGGCDLPLNMQWLPVEIKSCAAPTCKDRWERRVYRGAR